MKKKIILGVIAAIIVGAVGVWYFVFYRPTHFRRSVESENAVVITAKDIVKEFQTNEDSAYAKYNNKAIEVSGVVQQATTDSTGTTILLLSDDPMSNVSCRLKTVENNIQSGANITVKGLFTGFIGDVQLNEAIITKK
ncbi:MAG: OB-fold protein [Chitinophagaceae bacterium]